MVRLTGAPADFSHLDQSVPYLSEDPGDEGGVGHLLGLFYQLRYGVRLDNERNFGLTLTTFEVNDGKHIVDQLVDRVVAPVLLREVSTHVDPYYKMELVDNSVFVEPGRSD